MLASQLPRLHTHRPYECVRLLHGPLRHSDELHALVQEVVRESAASQGATTDNLFALLPDTLAFLGGLLARTAPDLIVEFGSGRSTKTFANWAALNRKRVISVEHDRQWLESIERELSPDERRVLTMLHAPLRLRWHGLRQFLTYESLHQITYEVQRADFFLLDGPHVSGREDVLYFVLCNCREDAIVVIDDLRLRPIGEMLETLPPSLAECFAVEVVDENSHGLGVLRCLRRPVVSGPPTLSIRSVLRSYWRCVLDYRRYGTGD